VDLMTEAQRRSIERSLLELLPILDAVGTGFYTRLVALDPTLQPLLPPTVEAQLQLFRDALGVMIATLDPATSARRVLAELGARGHAAGIPRHAYATAGQALVEILALALEPTWTPARREAWAAFYAEIVTIMAPLRDPAEIYPWGYSTSAAACTFL
jgi:hemoglobin-like flavoprotein